MPAIFDQNFVALARGMEAARLALGAVPDDHGFTPGQLDILDEVRRSALRLASTAEGILSDLTTGKKE